MGLADLAAGVRAARTHQTLDDIHDKGGPSPNTVGRLSRFDPGVDEPWPLRPATLAELDAGIDGWSEGDAQRLYDIPATRPGVVVTDVDQLADAVSARVAEALVARLRVRLDLADAP